MKILLIGSGSSYSTADVQHGYYKALKSAGHDVGLYDLTKRIILSRGFLAHSWRKLGKPAEKQPTSHDLIYMACEEICQRANRFDVDWVLFVAGGLIHPDCLIALRNSGRYTALLATEAPYDDDKLKQQAAMFDVMLVNERASVDGIKAVNPYTYYLGPAFDPDRHNPTAVAELDEHVPSHDVVFVGSYFSERGRALAAVDWTGIDFALYGYWKQLGPRSHLRQYVRGGIVDNALAAALYRKARIGLNLYRWGKGWKRNAPPVERADSLNPRAVELAACGVFTLSDYRAEVAEIFGDAVPTFATPAELQDLARYYLEHEDERQAKAARLPQLIAGHSFGHRAATLTEILEGQS